MSNVTQAIAAHSQRARLTGGAAVLALLMGAVACENDDNPADASMEAVGVVDGGRDGGEEQPDGEIPHGDFDADSGDDIEGGETEGNATTGLPCESADDCDDGVFCNGKERCVEDPNTAAKICQPALREHCPSEHLPCDEVEKQCNCTSPDEDDDGENAIVCGGEDCDDSTRVCHSKATEVCDENGRDEDCNPITIGDRDADGDHFVDHLCRNFDPDTGELHEGTDCDDKNRAVYPDALEVCDYFDNNCNEFTDEITSKDGSFEQKDNGLMNTFLFDADEDGHGDIDRAPELYCVYTEPPGYILSTNPQDCDDKDPRVYEGATEFCDGVDNDCDGLLDADDTEDLFEEYHFTGTTVLCLDGKWTIPANGCPNDTRWCPERGDPIGQGCRTDATRLSSCRACQTDCQFACGESGCDEILKVAAGGDQTCAVTREGRITCWGRGAEGRLGNDSTAHSSRPVWVVGLPDGKTARDVAVGFAHACAIVGDERELWCWGANNLGQLGQFKGEVAVPFVAAPVRVPLVAGGTLTRVTQLSAGRTHTCAVQESGRLVCFGDGQKGRLGNATAAAGAFLADSTIHRVYDEIIEEYVTSNVTDVEAVAVGEDHGCALLRGGTVECWGDNSFGQLGNGRVTTEPALGLEPVPELSSVQMIAAGAFHTCAIKDGKVFCWGRGTEGQLGRPPGQQESTPMAVAGLSDIVSISAGREFTCARSNSGRIACWGLNEKAQLGTAEPRTSATPLLLPVEGVQALSQGAGWSHICARGANHVVCWGSNSYGQLGVRGSLPLQFEKILPAIGELH